MYHSKSTPFFGRKQGLSRPAIDDLCVTIQPKPVSSYVKPHSEFLHNSAYMYMQYFLASGGLFPGDIAIQGYCPPGGKTTIAKTMDETVYTHHENYHRMADEALRLKAHMFYQLTLIPDLFINREFRELMHSGNFRVLTVMYQRGKIYGEVLRMTVPPISMRAHALYLKATAAISPSPYSSRRSILRNYSFYSDIHYGSLWRLQQQHKYPDSIVSGAVTP